MIEKIVRDIKKAWKLTMMNVSERRLSTAKDVADLENQLRFPTKTGIIT